MIEPRHPSAHRESAASSVPTLDASEKKFIKPSRRPDFFGDERRGQVRQHAVRRVAFERWVRAALRAAVLQTTRRTLRYELTSGCPSLRALRTSACAHVDRTSMPNDETQTQLGAAVSGWPASRHYFSEPPQGRQMILWLRSSSQDDGGSSMQTHRSLFPTECRVIPRVIPSSSLRRTVWSSRCVGRTAAATADRRWR